MFMHYAVHAVKEEAAPLFLDLIGGYYETDWSTNPHWKADLKINASHPIGRGVNSTTIEDEWYFNMRFRDGMQGVTEVATSMPTEDKITIHRKGGRWWNENSEAAMNKNHALMWATDSKGGGRGVGFTGGHWHKNWANDDQRKLVLNAFHWISGLDVPSKGVDSVVSDEDMKENLDPKPPKKKRPVKKKKKN